MSEWVDQQPDRAKRVIANIVDEHTITAINNWGCTFSKNISNYYLVYTNSSVPQAKFGDDVMSSDNLTNYRAICFDGGIQSLLQLINMLDNHVMIDCIVGIRNEKYKIDPDTQLPYLSAAEFLAFLKMKLNSTQLVTKDHIQKCIEEYLETHALYSLKKGDAHTKDSLFKAAMEKLFAKEIWNKLNLINFHQCSAQRRHETSLIGKPLGIFSSIDCVPNVKTNSLIDNLPRPKL